MGSATINLIPDPPKQKENYVASLPKSARTALAHAQKTPLREVLFVVANTIFIP